MTQEYKPMGGSEIAYYTMSSMLEPGWEKDINLMLSFCNPDMLDSSRKNIVWQQLNWNEENVAAMANEDYINAVDVFVWVSHWQYNIFRNKFNVPAYKSVIIKNATHTVDFLPRERSEKLKLIYTSTPWRGLDIVLEAFRLLNRDDVELDVFSSTKIYGPNFEKITQGQFDWLFDLAKNMPGVNYHGYAPNDQVRSAVANAHIFAYPSTFEETSCISAIEALIAGCNVITSDLGALPETCGDWTTYVTYGPNRALMAQRYAVALNNAINNYWTNETQELIREQSIHYNKHYSWTKRITEWKNLFSNVLEI